MRKLLLLLCGVDWRKIKALKSHISRARFCLRFWWIARFISILLSFSRYVKLSSYVLFINREQIRPATLVIRRNYTLWYCHAPLRRGRWSLWLCNTVGLFVIQRETLWYSVLCLINQSIKTIQVQTVSGHCIVHCIV